MIVSTLAKEFNIKTEYLNNIISLIDEGNTIPFIARYRKELTGHQDDQVLRELSERLSYLKNLIKRKEEISASISQQDKMTDELQKQLDGASTLAEAEDIYRPFRPKKKTRASTAAQWGLTPLAEIILSQDYIGDITEEAEKYINENVSDAQSAIKGALDIIAETISDNAEIRKKLREVYIISGAVVSTFADKTKPQSKIFEMYGDYSEEVSKIPSHRVLALNRGESEGVLRVKIYFDRDLALRIISSRYIKSKSTLKDYIESACADSYDRLIHPSIEREIRAALTEKASAQAIKMFEENLKPLLLQPPVKNKVMLGLDPAYRTGCKIAVVDATGKVLDTTVIYPTPPQKKIEEAAQVLKQLISKHNVEVIAIGNGTASKESEIFVADLINTLDKKVSYAVVNEAGASVYSASKLAAEEFPQFDVSLRSAVSIARRLQDPLAELIKIDPKAIGVGQYQHDMPQAKLSEALGGVLEDCVSSVGVDLNTASVSLLSNVAGLSAAIAKNIIAYRDEKGMFKDRQQLLTIGKLGPKTFTQCAGFLRIRESDNILDNTAVHPESYDAAKKLLSLFGYSEEDVKKGNLDGLLKKINEYGEENAVRHCGVGVLTLKDITQELLKPGRDIREEFAPPELRSDIMDI
ncbi:MAG: Tex family protein, partial [Clostridia bacterium]|nr:Tex family protein [Clostridia bacterium]